MSTVAFRVWAPAVAVALALAAGGAARPAAAQGTRDADAADALFKSAKAAMDKGDLATACAQFGDSLRLDPAPGTLLNLGECEARAGRIAAALGHFQQARVALADGDYRVSFAEERVTALEKRVPRLAVTLGGRETAGVKVKRDGVLVGRSLFGLAAPVEPGLHVVTAEAPGRQLSRVEVTLAEGETETVEVEPGPPGPEVPAAGPSSSNASTGKTLAVSSLVAGGVSVAVGAVLGVVAKTTYDAADSQKNCPGGPGSCNSQGVQGGQSAHTEAGVSTGLFVAGGVLAAAGVTLLLLSPSSHEERGAPPPASGQSRAGAVTLSPAMGPAGAGFLLGGVF